MAIFFDAPVSPDALTTFVREVPLPSDLTLQSLFPDQTVESNEVNFDEIVQTNRTARFRAFDGRIHVQPRDAGAETRVKLPPLSDSTNMGEYERLQLEFARTGGTNRSALARAVYNDGENLTRYVRNRMEQAWGDVLVDGKLTIDENGYQGEADFGVPNEHLITAGTSWSDTANATVLQNLIEWSDVWVATNGSQPASFAASLKVIRLMQRNAEIINAVHGAAAERTRVTLPELRELLESEGLPTPREPYDTRVDVDGVSTRIIPDDRVIFLPDALSDLGFTAWGISATALELIDSTVSDFSFEDAPGIVGVVEKVGPPYREFTYVDAVGMPIIQNPRLLLVADVIEESS